METKPYTKTLFYQGLRYCYDTGIFTYTDLYERNILITKEFGITWIEENRPPLKHSDILHWATRIRNYVFGTTWIEENRPPLKHSDILHRATRIRNYVDAEHFLRKYEIFISEVKNSAFKNPENPRQLCKDMILEYASNCDNNRMYKLFANL